MEYATLAGTDLRVSRIGFGSWQFDPAWNPSHYSVCDLLDAVAAAVDHGITLFDTASAYGNGESERLLGRALARHQGSVCIGTKSLAASYDPGYLRSEVEASLRRLKVDRIDLFQVHWPKRPFTAKHADDLVSAMKLLQEEGKIRYGGVSNFYIPELTELCGTAGIIVSNQLPYSVIWRSIEGGAMTASEDRCLSVLAYSPLAQGLLVGRFSDPKDTPTSFRARLRFFDPVHFSSVRETLTELDLIAKDFETTTVEIALQWLLRKPNVAAAICGASNPAQVCEHVRCLERPLPEELMTSVNTVGEYLRQRFVDFPSMWTGELPAP
jgi:aryl-alcohol dehydrogenase-like predicted oxidoreductase